MSYVIYNKESTAMVRTSSKQFAPQRYSTERAAKGALTKGINNGYMKGSKEDYGVAESTYYAENIEKMVTRVNMMSGELYEESINTPAFMSPACESYWSM